MEDKKVKEYVLGFVFDEKAERVALMKKNRPLWQKGLLNGIGGKIIGNEGYLGAMVREGAEETGVLIKDNLWLDGGEMKGEGWFVKVFYTIYNDIDNLKNETEEGQVMVVNLADLNKFELVDGLDDMIGAFKEILRPI